MKRMFMIAVALFAAFSLSAQEPGKFRARAARFDPYRQFQASRFASGRDVRSRLAGPHVAVENRLPDRCADEGQAGRLDDFGGGDSEGEPAFARDRDRQ